MTPSIDDDECFEACDYPPERLAALVILSMLAAGLIWTTVLLFTRGPQ